MEDATLFEAHRPSPLLYLDKTSLLFVADSSETVPYDSEELKAGDEDSGQVVQITVEIAESFQATTGKANAIAAFFLVQHEVSRLIMSIIRADAAQSLPMPVRLIQTEGLTPYTLVAETKEWNYGKAVHFFWGKSRVRSNPVKWKFKFYPEVSHARFK